MKNQRLSLDRISSLPLNIIETILCLLPTKDAVRTSILSRNWRYNWVTIPKLNFRERDFIVTTKEDSLSNVASNTRKLMSTRRRLFNAIYQILLVHCGPIREFILSLRADETCFEIDQVLLYLSRNHPVKNIRIRVLPCSPTLYKVPLSIFSLHELTGLYIYGCYLNYPKNAFNGFGRLTSLHLMDVDISTETILRIIRTSPLLKRVTLSIRHFDDANTYEIDYLMIADLFQCLPAIEDIVISHSVIQACYDDAVPQEIPYSLVHLKSFYFRKMSFNDRYGLPFLVLLMRCSPNLEKLSLLIWQQKTEIADEDDYEIPSTEYSDIHLEHLNDLSIVSYANLNPEIEFVKHILATSPVLKKVTIHLKNFMIDKDEELKMLRILLRSPRASPVVDINVQRP